MTSINLRFRSLCMQTSLNRFLSQLNLPNLIQKNCTLKLLMSTFPLAFAFIVRFAYGKVENPLKLYRGEDCVEVLCNYISSEACRLYHMFPEKRMKPLTHEEWREFSRAATCHICFKGFKQDDVKIRDHCHYTGKYRGSAHNTCNLRYKTPHYIPIVFHNLSGYDTFVQKRTR